MIMNYIFVSQHNTVINWSLNKLDMLLFIKIKSQKNAIAREAQRKILARGAPHGTKVLIGGRKIFWWGDPMLTVERVGWIIPSWHTRLASEL